MSSVLNNVGDLLRRGTDAGGRDITNAGEVHAATFWGDGSHLTGLPSSPTPTLASVLAAGHDAGGSAVTNLGAVTIQSAALTLHGTVFDFVVGANGIPIATEYDVGAGQTFYGTNAQLTAAGAVAWRNDSGFGATDLRLRRTGAKAGAFDDGTGGAADLTVTGVAAAAGFTCGGAVGLGTSIVVTTPSGDRTYTFSGGLLTGIA